MSKIIKIIYIYSDMSKIIKIIYLYSDMSKIIKLYICIQICLKLLNYLDVFSYVKKN